MKREFDPTFLANVQQQYDSLYKQKPRDASRFLKDLCTLHMINIKTLHNHLRLGVRGARETPADVLLKHAEQDRYARLVWDMVQARTYDANRLHIKDAFELLQQDNQIPQHITMKQIYSSIDRLSLRGLSVSIPKSVHRHTPMAMWEMDFSKSRYFKLGKNGEVTIEDPRFTKKQDDGYSLQFGVAVDWQSRVAFVKYYPWTGESVENVIEFVLDSFEKKEGMMLLQGQPKSVYVDRGPGWRGRTQTGLKKLGVNQILGADEVDSRGMTRKVSNKKGRGMVERFVQTTKATMEARWHADLEHFPRKLTIAELNERVAQWWEEFNQTGHPTRKGEGKWEIFNTVAGCDGDAWCPSLRFPTDDARMLFTSSFIVTVRNRKAKVGVKAKMPVYAIFPPSVTDGKWEVVKDQTGENHTSYYLYHNGERHLLTVEGEELKSAHEAGVSYVERTEDRNAKLEGVALRRRFADELFTTLGLEMRELTHDDDVWEDVKPFFEQPRSINDVEEQVAWIRVRREAQPVKSRATIIQL